VLVGEPGPGPRPVVVPLVQIIEWRGSAAKLVAVVVEPRTYRVTWLWLCTPATMAANETRGGINITLRNDSSWTWPATGTNRVRLSYHWLDGAGKTAVWDGLRTPLPHDVPPGEQVELGVTVRAPGTPGAYSLVWDMLEVGIAWFEWRGKPPLSLSVRVVEAQVLTHEP
jgi:hypothetical protein